MRTLRQAEDAEARSRAVRSLKNQIIGNKAKKMQYIKAGAVPTIVSALATALAGSPTDSRLLVACAVSIGSFAHGLDAGADAVLQCGGLTALLDSVSSSDSSVVEAAVRALNSVCSQARTGAPTLPTYLAAILHWTGCRLCVLITVTGTACTLKKTLACRAPALK